jgi:hypothetical protein
MALLRDEKRDALALTGKVELPTHLVALSEDGEARVDLLLFEGELVQGPFDAHEEKVLQRVDVLLQINDIAAMGEDEAGDIVHQARLVRAVDEKSGGVGVGHGAWWKRALLAEVLCLRNFIAEGRQASARLDEAPLRSGLKIEMIELACTADAFRGGLAWESARPRIH